MPIATYNAILGRSTSELPNSIVVGIDASRARIKENEVMRRAMQQAQDKVTEYWKRLERHETEAMEQQKAMLVLQNQNEVLQKNQNPRSVRFRSFAFDSSCIRAGFSKYFGIYFEESNLFGRSRAHTERVASR